MFLVVLPFLFLKPNRCRAAWIILLPLALVGGLLMGLSTFSTFILPAMWRMSSGLAVGWTTVWLLMFLMAGRPRWLSFLMALGIQAAVGLIVAVIGTGSVVGAFAHTLGHTILAGLMTLALAVSLWLCRRRFSGWRLAGWLLAIHPLLLLMVTVPMVGFFFLRLALGGGVRPYLGLIASQFVAVIVAGLLLAALTLVFLAPALATRHYRRRLQDAARLPGMPAEPVPEPPLAAAP